MTTANEIQMVPLDAITVLNPRARNRRVFHELITSIAHLGLKKPITVSRRRTEPGYDLVCGQGRLEAFILNAAVNSRHGSNLRPDLQP